ncbi:phosphoglycerate kinase, partial [Candidatus Parcubacteria bacterium]|nr:phosphoglycerate kinase [Candidatus Parcubacteria bacterium]
MPTLFKKIADEKDLRGKKVLLRLDLNVPIENGAVRDDFRIRRSLPTLRMLRERGAKTIVISHIESGPDASLAAVASYISKSVEINAFVADRIS